MSDSDIYDEYMSFVKENRGKVVVLDGGEDYRLRLSPHKYPDSHETVVVAAIMPFDGNLSNYETHIRLGLDNGRGDRSVTNDGAYTETKGEAVEWLEDRATDHDGSPLNWDDRDRVHITTEALEENNP